MIRLITRRLAMTNYLAHKRRIWLYQCLQLRPSDKYGDTNIFQRAKATPSFFQSIYTFRQERDQVKYLENSQRQEQIINDRIVLDTAKANLRNKLNTNH